MHISVFIAMPCPSRRSSHNHSNSNTNNDHDHNTGDRRSSETVETMDSVARAKGKGRSSGDDHDAYDDDGKEESVDDLDLMLGFTSVSFNPVQVQSTDTGGET